MVKCNNQKCENNTKNICTAKEIEVSSDSRCLSQKEKKDIEHVLPLKGKKICLDAGHYGKINRSPGIPEYYESDMVWKLHLLQKKHLEALGATVIMTRTSQVVDKALKARGQCSKDCDLFISNHSNATGNGMNESIDYVAVYHLVEDVNADCDDISKEFAKLLAPAISEVMQTKQGHKILIRKSGKDLNNDGAFNDNYYGVLNGARSVDTPGLILEHSFHTNSKSVRWLLNDDNLDRLARAEVQAIKTYFERKNSTVANDESFKIKVANVAQNDVLYVRREPNAKADSVAELAHNDPNTYTIVQCEGNWGKLRSGIGWINLKYTKRV